MLEFSKRTNTLEQTEYEYTLQDVEEPNLYRLLYNYDEVPKIPFNHRHVPMHPPDEIFITDTTFRDGQQAREPYTVEQIVQLYTFLHELGGPKGIIRQSEFFLYSEKDRRAVEACRALGFRYPEITSWIRARKEDFHLVKELGITETGILASCSDYHIFKKLRMTRRQAMDQFLGIVKDALEVGVRPRVHLEDITRADFYGFVMPLAFELSKLSQESGIPIKIRACDTLGYGVSYPGVALPRSVPGIAYGLWHYGRFPSELLEWHGHNDFYRAVVNAGTAWLYGIAAVNCTLLGIGERTGNTPLEAMVFEYAALRGTTDGMNTRVITEIADYYRREIGYEIPPMTPLVGEDFTTTRAGIHADGLLKDEEIYNIFDTGALLNRPVRVLINQTSGAAGLVHWLKTRCNGQFDDLDKRDPRLAPVLEWITAEYDGGRMTVIGDAELEARIAELSPELYAQMVGGDVSD
ncbi:MAG TPA: 2-isopropylmalate synthase [Chloroflexi bacterium]|jgi:isopropylmalate/homocitrate/citramalate synthase|nr:2-isopropylmalate synthase [Chloroflexota bacterium]